MAVRNGRIGARKKFFVRSHGFGVRAMRNATAIASKITELETKLQDESAMQHPVVRTPLEAKRQTLNAIAEEQTTPNTVRRNARQQIVNGCSFPQYLQTQAAYNAAAWAANDMETLV